MYHGHGAFYSPDEGREACTLSHKILISVEHIKINQECSGNCFYRVCKCDIISRELDWIEMNWFDISNADD